MDNNIWIAFVTGLTAGGLSCMAVQGGLVTSSLASQVEKDLQQQPESQKKYRDKRHKPRIQLAKPILLFLLAKLIAYTLLGALMGALGNVFSLTPRIRGILQLLIAVFMIGNALRMLNVHPVFRFFSFEPPAFITRFIRKRSKDQTSLFTPLFLGALTVFIPCGVTQSMLALAVSTGNPLTGAAILFAFTLGASPVFFGLTYLATRLGSLLEKYFVRIVAIAMFLLGLVAIDSGLNLLGSPFSFSKLPQLLAGSQSVATAEVAAQSQGILPGVESYGPQTATPTAEIGQVSQIDINVRNNGYQPNTISAPANAPLTLNLITDNTTSCSRAFVIPALDLSVLLNQTGSQMLEIPAQTPGTQLQFSCSMGMYTGVIIFQ